MNSFATLLSVVSLTVPSWYVWGVVFVLGAIIGSFLNVVIYRFHTGKSINGHSHCLSCATPLQWFELFPIISYLALRARCRSCGCRIPSRYFVVEVLTAVLFVLVGFIAASLWQLVLLWFVMAVLVIILVYDVNHFIIPDELTLLTLGAVSLLFGERMWLGYPYERVAVDIAAAAAGAAFFYAVWFITKGRGLGFGDVKLAFPLGLLVGAGQVFTFVVLSFWIGAAVSVFIILFQWVSVWKRGKISLRSSHSQLTMKSAVPFAPFLIASCLVSLFTTINVISLFSFI